MSEPNRIRVMANQTKTTTTHLQKKLAGCYNREEQDALRERIRNVTQLERWMRTRAGYR